MGAGAPLLAYVRRQLMLRTRPAALSGARGVLGGGGRIRPTLPTLTISEAALMLQGLYLVNLEQLRNGARPISAALHRGSGINGYGRRLRYIRRDPLERWKSIRDIWLDGGGDCEDLAAAVAAELTVMGVPARPVIYVVREGLAHAVVQLLDTGELIDPSKTGGMGEV